MIQSIEQSITVNFKTRYWGGKKVPWGAIAR